MCLASIGLLLIALVGGMFLLAKSDKDTLGIFYKVVAWFVIVLATLCLLCCGMRCAMGRCGMNNSMNCHGMMMGGGMCEDEGGMCKMNKRICIKMDDDDEDGGCEMKGGKCDMECMEHCKMMGKDCCKEGKGECKMNGEKMEMKKDTVVIKK